MQDVICKRFMEISAAYDTVIAEIEIQIKMKTLSNP